MSDKMPERVITVSDINPLMPRYHVLTERGRELGEKVKGFGYLKPKYDSRGRRTGGKWDNFELRKYKATPPWFKLQIVEIRSGSFGLEVYVKEA